MIYEGLTNHRMSAPGVDDTSWSDWWSQTSVNHSSFFKYMICTLGTAFEWDTLDCFWEWLEGWVHLKMFTVKLQKYYKSLPNFPLVFGQLNSDGNFHFWPTNSWIVSSRVMFPIHWGFSVTDFRYSNLFRDAVISAEHQYCLIFAFGLPSAT